MRCYMLVALMVTGVLVAGCQEKPSLERIGGRMQDGAAEVLIGLCRGEEIAYVRVTDPVDGRLGNDDDRVIWELSRSPAASAEDTDERREALLVIGNAPEGFTESVSYKGPLGQPVVSIYVEMVDGSQTSTSLGEAARDLESGQWVRGNTEPVTTAQLLADRDRVCSQAGR